MDQQPPARPAYPPGTIRVGSVAGVVVLVRSSWIFVALLLAYLLGPAIREAQPDLGAAWSYVGGLAYAVVLYFTVLLHEMSHAIAAKRFGLPVRWITLSFLGGMTTIDGEPQRPIQQFWIAAVGPLTSILVGVVAMFAGRSVHEGVVGLVLAGIAYANLVIGLLNLVPGLPLDGGRVLQSLVWMGSGDPHRGTLVSAWAGRVVAVLTLASPLLLEPTFGYSPTWIDFALAWIVAAFLWTGASAAIANVRIRVRLPALKARELARRVIAVPEDLSVAEAVRRAQEAGAGGIVVHTSNDQVTGIVSEAALNALPEDRRPWQPVVSVARTFEEGLVLPADLAGEELIRAIGTTPAAEYILVEQDGSIYGLLSTKDVDRAFAAGGQR